MSFLLSIHIVFGFISLILFWIPVFTRRGSNWHRKVGKLYVGAMWLVVLSAAILSIENISQGAYRGGLFLGFLALITANPLWYGVAILNHKKGISKQYTFIHMGFNVLVFAMGLFMMGYGLTLIKDGDGILMLFFGLLGVSAGPKIVKDYRNNLANVNWFKQHYEGMIISGIAAYTAFFAFGGRQFFASILTDYLQILPWILPTVIGVIGIRRAKKYYRKKGLIPPAQKG